MSNTVIIDRHHDHQGVGQIIGALLDPRASDPGAPNEGQVWTNTTTNQLKIYVNGSVEPIALLSDVTAGSITGALWDAQSVVTAVADDTPVATVIGEATVLGRLTGGNITAVTFAQLLSALVALGIDADTVDGSEAADLLARANHTGTQTTSTISDFTTAAQSLIDASVAALVDSSPGTLDTLNELAAALGDDPNFATTISNTVATKVKQYEENIGNGALQTFTINHALGTSDVNVIAIVNASGNPVEVGWEVTDANNVQVDTVSTPTTDQYRIIVQGV